MSLTAAQLAARAGKLTASRVGALMSGDADKIMNLWRFMIGEAGEDDLSWVWPVQLGEATEELHLRWYAHTTGHTLSRQGEVVVHSARDWAAATLDAWDDDMSGPVDAKSVGGFEPRETVVARYTPQMMWQMLVTGSVWSALSIMEGAREPVIVEVPWDEMYASELLKRAEAFMECVQSLTPPFVMPPVAAPVNPERIVSMEGNNFWGEQAGLWLQHRDAAKAFEAATKAIKELVPPDAAKTEGHGITATRDKRGVSIKETKA